jgi:hypothetical protein
VLHLWGAQITSHFIVLHTLGACTNAQSPQDFVDVKGRTNLQLRIGQPN